MANTKAAVRKTPIAFRLPVDLIRDLNKQANRFQLSRNKATELILRDYLRSDGKKLGVIVEEGASAEAHHDLFA
jgi:hypothetical protein